MADPMLGSYGFKAFLETTDASRPLRNYLTVLEGTASIWESTELDRDRLIDLVAALNAVVEHGDARRVDYASELWRALPEHLRKAIEKKEAKYE